MVRIGDRIGLAGLPLLLALGAALLGEAQGPAVLENPRPAEACLAVFPPIGPVAALLPEHGGDALEFHRVVITGYSSSDRETDDSPDLTASMTPAQDGCLALSRDLLRTFTPKAPFDFGDYVLIPKVGIFLVQDTMHPRWRSRADIWFADSQTAARWGRRTKWIGRLPVPPDQNIGLFALGLSPDLGRALSQP
jgi:3D (Asp-Asp-Asp) domain-containing protein